MRRLGAWFVIWHSATAVYGQRHSSESHPISFFVIVARQRSSSTYLTTSIHERLMSENGSAVWLTDEPWISAHDRPHNREIDQICDWSPALRMDNPHAFLQALRSSWCNKHFHHAPVKVNCILVLKLFDIHFTMHSRRGSVDVLAALFSDPGARIIVLERDPAAEQCSLRWANLSHHWWLPSTPAASRVAYEKFKETSCGAAAPSSEDEQEAYRSHVEWFSTVHAALRIAPGALERSLNVTYQENVEHHEALMSRINAKFLK